MPVIRDPPPQGADVRGVVDWVNRQLDYVTAGIVRLDAAMDAVRRIFRSLGISANWRWADGTADVDPGIGRMASDTAQLNASTLIRLSKTTLLGFPVDLERMGTVLPEFLLVHNDNRSVSEVFDITAPAIDGGTYWKIPVVINFGSNVNSSPDEVMRVAWYPRSDVPANLATFDSV